MIDYSFKASKAFDPIHGVICPKDHWVLSIKSELVEMFARASGSLKSTNEQVFGVQKTLWGSIVIESANSIPRILCLCLVEKASWLP
jgi:hypothetical protein